MQERWNSPWSLNNYAVRIVDTSDNIIAGNRSWKELFCCCCCELYEWNEDFAGSMTLHMTFGIFIEHAMTTHIHKTRVLQLRVYAMVIVDYIHVTCRARCISRSVYMHLSLSLSLRFPYVYTANVHFRKSPSPCFCRFSFRKRTIREFAFLDYGKYRLYAISFMSKIMTRTWRNDVEKTFFPSFLLSIQLETQVFH